MKLRMLAITTVVLIGLAGTARSEDQPKAVAPKKSVDTAVPVATAAKTNTASAPATAPVAKTDARDSYIVIGYLEKRDGTVITIKSGPKGAAYTVASKDGKVLYENLSSDQLQAKAPELHDFIKSAVAGDSKAKSVKDSRLRLEGRL
jgi:hypothetical protein